jgi:glycosyltransferase involved in cell wall biosynthesis
VLVVFGEQSWDASGQRVTQLLSRLAGRWRVVFVEPPRPAQGPTRLECIARGPDLDVLVPALRTPGAGADRWDGSELAGALDRWWRDAALPRPLAWLLDPLASSVACGLDPIAFVPSSADQTDDVDGAAWFGEGVDVDHFEGRHGGWDAEEVRRLEAAIPEPRLGFPGPIDGSVDCAWLDSVANARPDWQFVMVGDPQPGALPDLPRRANLHWLGDQPYRLLPELMAGWRVGLLPLVPDPQTKPGEQPALQLMAAGLPIVASTERGLAAGALQSGAVAVAGDPASFVKACEAALAESEGERARRRARTRPLVERCRWDDLAERAHQALLALADGPD